PFAFVGGHRVGPADPGAATDRVFDRASADGLAVDFAKQLLREVDFVAEHDDRCFFPFCHQDAVLAPVLPFCLRRHRRHREHKQAETNQQAETPRPSPPKRLWCRFVPLCDWLRLERPCPHHNASLSSIADPGDWSPSLVGRAPVASDETTREVRGGWFVPARGPRERSRQERPIAALRERYSVQVEADHRSTSPCV